MSEAEVCPECGAAWPDDRTCGDYFNQMLAWEIEDPESYRVHHLMVLSFHLQHPSRYSPDGLVYARRLLTDFVGNGLSPEEVRLRNRSKVDSGRRAWKIKGTSDSHGSYDRPIKWSMTAADIVSGGMDDYCANVRAWAQCIYEELK